MFALDSGYTTFAGPCDINDPGSSNRVRVGSSIHSVVDRRRHLCGPQDAAHSELPHPSDLASPSAATGKIQVRLVDRVGGGAGYGNCGARRCFFDNWVRLPGTVDTSGYLTVPAYAVPTGRYEICVRQTGPWGSFGAARQRTRT